MTDVLRTRPFDKGEYEDEPAIEVFIKNSIAYVCVYNVTNYKCVCMCVCVCYQGCLESV